MYQYCPILFNVHLYIKSLDQLYLYVTLYVRCINFIQLYIYSKWRFLMKLKNYQIVYKIFFLIILTRVQILKISFKLFQSIWQCYWISILAQWELIFYPCTMGIFITWINKGLIFCCKWSSVLYLSTFCISNMFRVDFVNEYFFMSYFDCYLFIS